MEGSQWSSKAQLQTLVKKNGPLSRGGRFFVLPLKSLSVI